MRNSFLQSRRAGSTNIVQAVKELESFTTNDLSILLIKMIFKIFKVFPW